MIREADERERGLLLQGDEGFVCETDGAVTGHVGWNVRSGFFYAHSCFCFGDALAFPSLIQALRKKARDMGYDAVMYWVSEDMPVSGGMSPKVAVVVARTKDSMLMAIRARINKHD